MRAYKLVGCRAGNDELEDAERHDDLGTSQLLEGAAKVEVSEPQEAGSGNASGVTADSPSGQFQAWPAIFEGVKNLPLAKARAAVVKNKCKQNETSCTWSTVGASQVIQEYGKRIVTIVKKQCTVTSLLIPLVQLHLGIGSQSVSTG